MSNWSLLKKIGLGAILSFLGTIIISGIIGNRADALFVWLWELIATSITAQSWPLIIALVLLIIVLAYFLVFFWRRNNVLSSRLDTMNNVVKLDDSLLRLLPSLISAQDREGEMKRLLLELLRDVTRAFAGDVHRASILLPDSTKEYLRVWVHYQMPEESGNKRQFYVCFDSESETVFDPLEIQDMLLMLGRRIATALLIYQQLPLSFKQHKHFSATQISSTKLN